MKLTARALSRISMAAVLGISFHAEYGAGRAIGLPEWHPLGADLPAIGLPLLLPLAIDCYVVSALERNRDVPAALAVLAAAIVGGSVYHAEQWQARLLAAGAGLLLVVVMWRNHVVARAEDDDRDALRQARQELAAARRDAARAAETAAERDRLADELAAAHERAASLNRDLARAGGPAPAAAGEKRPPAPQPSRPAGGNSTGTAVAAVRREHPKWTQAQVAQHLGVAERTVRRYWAAEIVDLGTARAANDR